MDWSEIPFEVLKEHASPRDLHSLMCCSRELRKLVTPLATTLVLEKASWGLARFPGKGKGTNIIRKVVVRISHISQMGMDKISGWLRDCGPSLASVRAFHIKNPVEGLVGMQDELLTLLVQTCPLLEDLVLKMERVASQLTPLARCTPLLRLEVSAWQWNVQRFDLPPGLRRLSLVGNSPPAALFRHVVATHPDLEEVKLSHLPYWPWRGMRGLSPIEGCRWRMLELEQVPMDIESLARAFAEPPPLTVHPMEHSTYWSFSARTDLAALASAARMLGSAKIVRSRRGGGEGGPGNVPLTLTWTGADACTVAGARAIMLALAPLELREVTAVAFGGGWTIDGEMLRQAARLLPNARSVELHLGAAVTPDGWAHLASPGCALTGIVFCKPARLADLVALAVSVRRPGVTIVTAPYTDAEWRRFVVLRAPGDAAEWERFVAEDLGPRREALGLSPMFVRMTASP